MIQRPELFPVGLYYFNAAIGAVVGAIMIPLINTTELIRAVRDEFMA